MPGERPDAQLRFGLRKLLLRNATPELLQLVETARLFKEYVRHYVTVIKKDPKGFARAFHMPDALALLS